MGTPGSRFVEGCSTGGWVSLALQLFYPDFFGGCFSYSPDQVDFENCQLINIYKDKNAFYNEYGYLRPIMREVSGEPILSHKDFIQFENVLGRSDTYVTSGGQFSAFTALFSPKGKDGLPAPMFDPMTGEIDHEVAEYWRKHDLKKYVETNWETLGPKIQGKIWVWAGDMDNFYLNPATRAFDEMLKTMDNPKSDASVNFTPMKGHCAEYNERKVIEQIIDKIQTK
jgi:S-formylglutathione hydrolase FrmB